MSLIQKTPEFLKSYLHEQSERESASKLKEVEAAAKQAKIKHAIIFRLMAMNEYRCITVILQADEDRAASENNQASPFDRVHFSQFL